MSDQYGNNVDGEIWVPVKQVPTDNLYYCRTPLPRTDGSEEQRARALALAKDHAIGQVRYGVDLAGLDFEVGCFRVTTSMDSHLERECVIAEWWCAADE